MRTLVYLMPLLGSIAASIVFLLTIARAESAPQEAAGFAMACALAVVPYVFARAIDLARDEVENHRKRQTIALEQLAELASKQSRQT